MIIDCKWACDWMDREIVETGRLILRAVKLDSAQSKEPVKITDQHRKRLCQLLRDALIEMRMLGWSSKSPQVADLAEASLCQR